MSLLKAGVDYFLVYRFIKALTTPFKKTKAFELGIIDDEGNFIKKFKELKTKEEKGAFGAYDRMILNLKKIIEKVPVLGKALTSWAGMAYLLLKEGCSEDEFVQIRNTCFLKYVQEDLECLVEIPTNNTSSGNIAGLPPDDPPVSKKNQKKHKKRNSTSGKSGRKILSAKLKSRG